ncbi:interferon gamma-related-like [Astyanax mexicanus]|uniref:Interferon gamma-related-like n=1 Tax=Astyanax mexicanus TaxID=7994 RepID=A0A8T2M9Q1_ASTMX|nr:interferon gamma-related-like [Astyanax mexicanus]
MDSWCSLHVVLMYGLVAIELLNGTAGFSIPRQHLNADKAVKAVQNHYVSLIGIPLTITMFLCFKTCTCEGLMYAAMLKTYEEIFADMMKKSTEVQNELKDLKNNVTQLMRNYTKEQKVLHQLEEIRHKDVKNFTIQGGAVNDFRSVFDLASKGGQN